MVFIERPFCETTGAPFGHDFGSQTISADALANPPAYDKARAACVHTSIARQLVTRLKYGDRTELAPWMARWMVRAGSELIGESDVIVPVPLHGLRRWNRRYNQSAELARAIARQTGLPMRPGALIRARATKPQVGLTAKQRALNVRGVFAVPAAQEIAIKGRRVLLIDDVLTTGATIDAASKTLIGAGATAVHVLTFSRVSDSLVARGA